MFKRRLKYLSKELICCHELNSIMLLPVSNGPHHKQGLSFPPERINLLPIPSCTWPVYWKLKCPCDPDKHSWSNNAQEKKLHQSWEYWLITDPLLQYRQAHGIWPHTYFRPILNVKALCDLICLIVMYNHYSRCGLAEVCRLEVEFRLFLYQWAEQSRKWWENWKAAYFCWNVLLYWVPDWQQQELK